MKIIIYAICKNEAQFAARFMASCAEAAVRLAPKDARLARNLEIMRQRGAKA